LEQARAFFLDTLGFRQVGAKPDYPAVFVSDGEVMVTLWQAADAENAVPFDRRNHVGLHHLALRLPDRASLHALHTRLAMTAGVAIEFAPEPLGGGPTHHMMCAIPGGIRVEFIAPAT
jgi:catechol-2,3-dioxygenase